MSEWEEIFGEGVSAEDVIDDINNVPRRRSSPSTAFGDYDEFCAEPDDGDTASKDFTHCEELMWIAYNSKAFPAAQEAEVLKNPDAKIVLRGLGNVYVQYESDTTTLKSVPSGWSPKQA